MLVSGFMIPADKVVKCTEWDPITKIIDEILYNNISAVVVVDSDAKPVGIVSKTDLVAAYKQGIPLHQKVSVIMQRDLISIKDTTSRDNAAKAFEGIRVHHALVVDKDENFVGLISTFDIAAECARDARAFPWNRTPDGKVPSPAMGVH